jgi:hypothetical protein
MKLVKEVVKLDQPLWAVTVTLSRSGGELGGQGFQLCSFNSGRIRLTRVEIGHRHLTVASTWEFLCVVFVFWVFSVPFPRLCTAD